MKQHAITPILPRVAEVQRPPCQVHERLAKNGSRDGQILSTRSGAGGREFLMEDTKLD